MHPTEFLLNEFADDALANDERTSVDDHLRHCEECRTIVRDLHELRRATDGLGLLEPPDRAWRRIESAIDRRRSSFVESPSPVAGRSPSAIGRAWPVERWGLNPGNWRPSTALWLGTAAALVLVSVVGLRVLNRPDATGPVASEETASAQLIDAELQLAQEHYQRAIRGLEQIANADAGALDPRTSAALRTNLALVDRAIEESRAALRTQPGSEPAQASLIDNFRAKIALLQDTVALINETRWDHEAGAAPGDPGVKRGM